MMAGRKFASKHGNCIQKQDRPGWGKSIGGKRMRGLAVGVALALSIGSASARGQAAIYVTSSSSRFSNVQTGSVSTASGYQEQYASYWASGIGGGVTLNFLSAGVAKLGFDFRGSTKPGTNGADTAMGGIKLAFNPPLLHFKPYVQASGGYVATRSVNISTSPSSPGQIVGGSFTNRYAAWELLGGIDYRLVPFLDLRLIEVGGGSGLAIPGSANQPHLTLFTVNTGVVFHF
jgi:hypothetical protein